MTHPTLDTSPAPVRHPPVIRTCLLAWCLLGLLPLGLSAAGGGSAPAAVQVSQVVPRGTALTAYVAVRDEADAPVAGIAGTQVHATVGGKAAAVETFKPFTETGEGVTYLLLVDVSQSLVGRRFEPLRKALREWVAALTPADRAGLIAFGSEVRTLVEPTADRAALDRALAALAPRDQQTRLHGAVLRALDLAHRQVAGLPERRAIVVLSDGLDDAPGEVTAEEVYTRLADGAVPIYGVAFGGRPAGLAALGQFARRSGGTVAKAGRGNPAPTLTAMRERIRAVYRAGLNCPECVADGNRHRVQIAVTTGGLTLDDGMDVRLYPTAAVPATTPAESPAATGATPPAESPVVAVAPPPNRTGTWVALAGALGGLLVLVLLVVRRRRRRSAARTMGDDAPAPDDDRLADWSTPTDDPSAINPDRVTPGGVDAGPGRTPGLTLALTFRTGTRRGQTLRLTLAPAVLIGRNADCTLTLPDDELVSGQHARLAQRDKLVLLEDLGSTNGTLLNGVAIHAPHPLADGDLVRLGCTEFRIGFGDHGTLPVDTEGTRQCN
jgi:Mg-chelatase subunit ChlD